MSALSTTYGGWARRRWLARRAIRDRAHEAEIDRLVAEARLAASLPHRPRPSRLDMHLFDPIARQFDPTPPRRNR